MRASRFLAATLTLSLLLEISGCATAIYGRKQEVSLSSEPSGARVTIDETQVGITPTTAMLSREDPHSVRIEKPGYVTYETTTASVEKPLKDLLDVPGAIVFPPLLLIILVDRWLGGTYEIHPTEVSAQLLSAPANPATAMTTAEPSPGTISSSEKNGVSDSQINSTDTAAKSER